MRPLGDREMHDGAVANVGPTAGQAIRVVAVTLQVRTPRLAPERRGDGPALDLDRGDRLALLDPPGDLLGRLGPALGHGDVGRISVVVVVPSHDFGLPHANLVSVSSRKTPVADRGSRTSGA